MAAINITIHLAAPIVLFALTVIFLQRRLNLEFPLFFAYMLYVPLTVILRMATMNRAHAYFWAYWATEAVYGVMGLLVLFEVFYRVFPRERALFRWFRWLLPGAAIVFLIISLLETFYHLLGHGRISPLTQGIYWFDVGVHALEGVVLALAGVLRGFRDVDQNWKRYEFGILLGFCISGAVTMTADLLRFELGDSYETFFRYGPPIAYLFAAVVWLHAFFRPQETRERPDLTLQEAQDEIQRGQKALKDVKKDWKFRHRVSVKPT